MFSRLTYVVTYSALELCNPLMYDILFNHHGLTLLFSSCSGCDKFAYISPLLLSNQKLTNSVIAE